MKKEINIYDLLKTKAADDRVKGDKVFQEIRANSEEYHEIVLDFGDIELVNTAFLNNAIGKLYNREQFDFGLCSVKIRNMTEPMLELLKESVIVAKQKFR